MSYSYYVAEFKYYKLYNIKHSQVQNHHMTNTNRQGWSYVLAGLGSSFFLLQNFIAKKKKKDNPSPNLV